MSVLLWRDVPSLRDNLNIEWTRRLCVSARELYSSTYTAPSDAKTIIFIVEGRYALPPLLMQSVNENVAHGKRVVMIHLSDEDCVFPPENYPRGATIIRSYYHPKYDGLCLFVPLGYSNFFNDQVRVHPVRPLMWSFAGCLIMRPHRQHMLSVFSRWSSSYEVHISSDCNSSDGLPRAEYRDMMSRSVFVPSSAGFTNAECYRTWEALEAGCIPITCTTLGSLPHYYDQMAKACNLPPIPWPQLTTWEDVFSLDLTIPWKEKCDAWWKIAKEKAFSLI